MCYSSSSSYFLCLLLFIYILEMTAMSVQEEFVIRVNTYRRPDLLTRFLDHYTTCPQVAAITVVWSDPMNSPPPLLHQPKVKLAYEIHTNDSLTNRFFNLSTIQTEAVLSVDDDVMISCASLVFALGVWRANPFTLVGFSPRLHGYDPYSGDARYYRWQHTWWNGQYSIVLTKACFLHRDHFVSFKQLVPVAVLKYVDLVRNGEDIAMAHVVASVTAIPPVWVKVDIYETSDTGISSGGLTHFANRGSVIQVLEETTGVIPWVMGYQKSTVIGFLDLFRLVWTRHK